MRAIRKTFALLLACAVVVATGSYSDASSQGNILERRAFGTSVQGRPLEAFRMGDPRGVTVAVVGVIHGNEEAGLLITDELLNMQVPNGVNLWVIPTINPDGTALNRRGNANRVDLNRNFPYGWAKIGQPGYWQYAGPSRASEPETKALVSFFREIKPALGLWYHQDLNIISPGVGFEGEIRARYGAITGLPMKRITGGTYTGVAATWQKKGLKNSMAFVVELGKTLNTEEAKVHASAVLDISMMLRDASSSKLGK
ncbi:MAG: M14 family metallopeptidase [Actinomycetes bacterium]